MKQNLFIKTTTKRELIPGGMILSGGSSLTIPRVTSNRICMSIQSPAWAVKGSRYKEDHSVILGPNDLEDLARILTEICEVMKENE